MARVSSRNAARLLVTGCLLCSAQAFQTLISHATVDSSAARVRQAGGALRLRACAGSRRSALITAAAAALVAASPGTASSMPPAVVRAVIGKDDALPDGAQEPSPEQTKVIQKAIRAFDQKELAQAETLFSQGIATWEDLERPRDEMAELYKMRANVRVDLKRFAEAKTDYDKVSLARCVCPSTHPPTHPSTRPPIHIPTHLSIFVMYTRICLHVYVYTHPINLHP